MIFALISFEPNKPLADMLVTTYPGGFFQADSDMRLFFVSDSGTAKDVSDKLEITSGSFGSVIVLAVSGYYGRAPMNIWEWLAATVAKPIQKA
jgi:hypothetical protein